jgi:hypothetical protein
MTAPTPAIVRPAARRRALRRDLPYRSGRSKRPIPSGCKSCSIF